MTSFNRGRSFVGFGLPEFDRSGLPTEASEVVRPVNAWPNQAGYVDNDGNRLSPADLERHGRATLRAAGVASEPPIRREAIDEGLRDLLGSGDTGVHKVVAPLQRDSLEDYIPEPLRFIEQREPLDMGVREDFTDGDRQ